MAFANSLSSLSRSKTILSIGKLAAKLTSEADFQEEQSRKKSDRQPSRLFDDFQLAIKEMDRNLAVIHVQEKLQLLCPRSLWDCH